MELADMFAQLRELTYKRQLHIADLVQLEAPIVEQRGIINGHIQAVDDAIAGVRKQIEEELRSTGEVSHTDPATRFNARLEQRSSWKVTNKDELYAAAKERPDLGLLVEVVDEKKAIARSKASGEALPGVELVESLTFAIHPPKEKK